MSKDNKKNKGAFSNDFIEHVQKEHERVQRLLTEALIAGVSVRILEKIHPYINTEISSLLVRGSLSGEVTDMHLDKAIERVMSHIKFEESGMDEQDEQDGQDS